MAMSRLPLTAFKCFVEFTIHEVSAPGVRLANKGDLYLNVCLLGQQRRTRIVPPVFPLKFGDHLMFQKTFKFCHDPLDVYNFLGESHVLVELIQLGRTDKNEVLAWFETDAKDFLYPSTNDFKSSFHSPQRDVFMVRKEGFPGSINPQIIFSTSTRINETQTPSLDILREYENRFVNDPLMDISNRQSKKRASKRHKNGQHGILRNKNSALNNPDFANHTISSAIKADYTLPGVKFKLDELNSSVKKTRIIKQAPSLKSTERPGTPNSGRISQNHQRPFVVRKVEDKLIERKPELHDMLHDGLVLTEKSRKRMRRNNKRNKRRSNSLSRLPDSSHFSDMERPRSHSPNAMSSLLAPQYENNSALYHAIQAHNNKNHNQLYYSNSPANHTSQFYDTRNRLSRSVSPFKLGISLNKNLGRQNFRSPRVHSNSNGASRSRSRSASSASRKFDLTYDVLSGENDNEESQSNCEVCVDHHTRRQSPLHKSQGLNNSSNSSAVFNKKKSATRRKRDPLNETQLLNSEDFARHTFAENYGPSSFNEAHELSNHKANTIKKHKHAYPKNQSFSHYAPPCYDVDWRYSRYYPWLFNYTEYLRDLEDELHWLKARSKHIHTHH